MEERREEGRNEVRKEGRKARKKERKKERDEREQFSTEIFKGKCRFNKTSTGFLDILLGMRF